MMNLIKRIDCGDDHYYDFDGLTADAGRKMDIDKFNADDLRWAAEHFNAFEKVFRKMMRRYSAYLT